MSEHMPPSPGAPEPDPLIGRVLAGRYRLTALLGKGGAGMVYRGIQDQLGRDVAVKLLRTDLMEETRAEFEARFLREAALAGRLSSPYIVTIHDYGQDPETGHAFVVMEYLHGRSLHDKLRDGPMHTEDALRVALGVAKGLRHAHGNEVIHRDIKPANILLVRDDDGLERPIIVDFGLVRSQKSGIHEEVTTTGIYMGTPAYMPPEQAKGEKDLSDKVDVYSFGVVLYRMLTGVLPYTSDNAVTTAVMHIQDPYPPMSARAPDVTVASDVEEIVRDCMDKDPTARPDAGELVQRLSDLIGLPTETTLRSARRFHEGGADPQAGSGGSASSVVLGLGALGTFGAVSFACSGIAVLMMALAQPGVPDAERPTVAGQVLPEHEVEEPIAPESIEEPSDAVADLSAGTAAPTEPEPDPEPEPEVESAPARAPVPKRAREPAPVAPPAEKIVITVPSAMPMHDKPAADGFIVADNVRFTPEHAARAVAWLNKVEEWQLRNAGLYDRGVRIVLADRPFSSIEAFAATPYIGEKTVQAVHEATRE